MEKKFAQLPKKVLVMMVRLMYDSIDENGSNFLFADEIKDAIQPLGFKSELAEDYSFLAELFKLNQNLYKEGKLNDKNIIIPKLKKLKVEYYEVRVETVRRSYFHTIETYSDNEHIIDELYFRDPEAFKDSVYDAYNTSEEDEDYIDGDTENSGIKIIGKK